MNCRVLGFMFLLVPLIPGCAGAKPPQPGETVAPKLTENINWSAGKNQAVWVLLYATDGEGKSRPLAHEASPKNNPKAQVVFYDSSGAVLLEQEYELNNRC